MSRFINPLIDIGTTLRLYTIFRKERFDLIHNMTVKPNVFGTFAGRAAGIKRIVCLVSGLGFTFAEPKSLRSRALSLIVRWLYRRAFSLADRVWFQNDDDFRQFVEEGLIDAARGTVIRGGGVDLAAFSMDRVDPQAIVGLRRDLGIPVGSGCVLMASARLIWSKGIKSFVEAANRMRRDFPCWVFVMLCPRDPGTEDEVPAEYLDANASSNLIVLDSFREDIRTFLALADIVTLPSYYREGVPRILLEAMAMGKPIITCDAPGCRETVLDGQNGFLIPPRNTEALVEKLRLLMVSPEKRHQLGWMSRKLAEEHFDENKVTEAIIHDLYNLGAA